MIMYNSNELAFIDHVKIQNHVTDSALRGFCLTVVYGVACLWNDFYGCGGRKYWFPSNFGPLSVKLFAHNSIQDGPDQCNANFTITVQWASLAP